MLEAIAFYSQGPNSYFHYWWFSHNDNCSHDEQGVLSVSQEQQIRQMVWGGGGGRGAKSTLAQARPSTAHSLSSGHILLGWRELDKYCCCRGIHMWIQIKPADWLKGYFQAFFLFFTNNISTTSLWKYMLNQKSIGTGPARPAFHSGIRTHRHEHPVISLRGLIGPDSVAVEKLSRKTLTLELSAGPRFQIANILKNIVCNFQTARWSDFQWVWVIPCKWSITEYWAVSKLQLFAASQLKRHFSKQKLVLVLPVSQIPVMSA